MKVKGLHVPALGSLKKWFIKSKKMKTRDSFWSCFLLRQTKLYSVVWDRFSTWAKQIC